MLRVQIRLYISPVLVLKPTIQGHPFSNTTHHRQHSCAAVLKPIGVVELKGLHTTPCHTHSFQARDLKIKGSD